MVYYGFGNSSGQAFGSTFQYSKTISYRYGQWCSATVEQLSNYKELLNLVVAMEEAGGNGKFEGCKIFLFTDNSTADEGAYYKGNTPSKTLFDLLVRLRTLATTTGWLILHVIHVSGKRMIAQGTDGLSCGDHTEGVMQGEQ